MVGAEGLVGKYNEYTFQTPDDSTYIFLKTVLPGKINDSACHIVSLSPREHTIHVALATVTACASLQRVPHCKALYQRAHPPRCPCCSAPLTQHALLNSVCHIVKLCTRERLSVSTLPLPLCSFGTARTLEQCVSHHFLTRCVHVRDNNEKEHLTIADMRVRHRTVTRHVSSNNCDPRQHHSSLKSAHKAITDAQCHAHLCVTGNNSDPRQHHPGRQRAGRARLGHQAVLWIRRD